MAQVFISYASPDRAFALRLAHHVELLGHVVWIDRWYIAGGDSVVDRISEGIEAADWLIVVLSKNTPLSSWVTKEWQAKYCEDMTLGTERILPALLEDCVVPSLLRPKRFADFRQDYALGLAHVGLALQNAPARYVLENRGAKLYHDDIASRQKEQAFCYNDDMVARAPRLTDITVELSIPYVGKIGGTWKPDEEEQRAAWELYIELVTRVTVAGLRQDEGLLRESLTSLYAIFTITREILRKCDPAIARPKHGGDLSFGSLAINVLNTVLRPILTKWHPLLLDYEHTKSPTVSALEHEKRWKKADELRRALEEARVVLVDYARILAHVAGVPQFDNK